MSPTRYPFEVDYSEVERNCDLFIDVIFQDLQSSILQLPRTPDLITYKRFQEGYEVLKRHTQGFVTFELPQLHAALSEDGLSFVVLRTMLGFTASEWAYVASQKTKTRVSQSCARSLDRRARLNRQAFHSLSSGTREKVVALVSSACDLLKEGAEEVPENTLHRLDKVDTRSGLASLRHLAEEDVPYSALLYERFLGRPFAAYRDAISERVGEVMENAVEEQLRMAGVTVRKTKRAERLEGFDQAPDFIVPNEWNPQVVIEAKITEDDGTARDKVTRIQHLASISRQRKEQNLEGFQIIACIDGRGFGVRRADMRKLLAATEGKVFTMKTLDRLVDFTDLARFRSKP